MESQVLRKSQLIAVGGGVDREEAEWITFFNEIHRLLSEGWTIIHVDDPRGDISVSLRKYP